MNKILICYRSSMYDEALLLRGQRRQCWQPWSCSGDTCRERSCHAMPPHRTASGPL